MPQIEDAVLPSLHEGLHSAELLHRAGKLNEALAELHQLRLAYPDAPDALARAIGLMLHLGEVAEAEPLVEMGRHRFPEFSAFCVYYASLADRRRDWEASAVRWAEVRRRFPDAREGYLGGGVSLSELGRFSEADAVLRDGIARLPDQFFLFVDYARVAERQRDWSLAARRWAEARSRFADQWLCHAGLASCLLRSGQAAEAETVTAAAAETWPERLEILVEHARTAEARGDWSESARRWEVARSRHADHWPAYVEGATALIRADRGAEAGALLARAVERFPGEATPLIRLARWHDSREEWQKSLPLWLALRRDAPELSDSHVGAAAALRIGGRLDEAQQAIDEARRRFPNEQSVIRERALVAYARENWAEAAVACAEGARLFPEEAWFPRFGFEVNVRLVDATAGAASPAPPTPGSGPSSELSDRERVMMFESLGGTGHGCEFGIYQRSHGAEPLGLLRWNDLNQDQLIDALESDFEGVGSPEQTFIFIPETKLRPQYWSRDRRFYMVSSTHVFVDEVPEEKLFPQLCRRLQFLRGKLIADLRAGEKIFVYKNMFRNLTEAELDRLYRAVRRYGDNTLLYLRYADGEHPDGTVEWKRRGLMLGYVARFTHAPDDAFLGPPDEMFDRVTRAAYRLWKSGTMPLL